MPHAPKKNRSSKTFIGSKYPHHQPETAAWSPFSGHVECCVRGNTGTGPWWPFVLLSARARCAHFIMVCWGPLPLIHTLRTPAQCPTIAPYCALLLSSTCSILANIFALRTPDIWLMVQPEIRYLQLLLAHFSTVVLYALKLTGLNYQIAKRGKWNMTREEEQNIRLQNNNPLPRCLVLVAGAAPRRG